MPAMNISLQRRIGKLPRSPDYLENIPPSIFEYNHRGFGTRRPTPTSKGFFGLGSGHKKSMKGHHGNEMGDGMNTAWYGNDGGRSLPAPGIYGIGSAPGRETVMNPMDFKPKYFDTPGMFGFKETVQDNLLPIAVVGLVGVFMYRNRK
jgi:hypothetical protein